MDAYLEKCRFLPRLNNELPDQRNSTYKERFSSLENVVLIMTNLYIEDWIGLKALDDAGKVKYVSVRGNHLGISHKDMKEYFVPYLESQAPSPRSSLKSMQRDQKKEVVQHHLKRQAHTMMVLDD